MSDKNKIFGPIRSGLVTKYESSCKIEPSDDFILSRKKRAQEHAYMALRAKNLAGRTLSHMECRTAGDVALDLRSYLNDVVIEALIGIYRPVSEMFPEGQKFLREDFFWKRFNYISKFIPDVDIVADNDRTVRSTSDIWYEVNVRLPRLFKYI